MLARCYARDRDRDRDRDREEKEKELETKKQKKHSQQKIQKFDAKKIELPYCINPEAWERWISYRIERRLTCTEQTMRLQVARLEDFYNKGHNPNSIIDESRTNGWTGLYEPKQQTQLHKKRPVNHEYMIDGREMTNAEAAEYLTRLEQMQSLGGFNVID